AETKTKYGRDSGSKIKSVIFHKTVRVAGAGRVAQENAVIVRRHGAAPRAVSLKSIGPNLLESIGAITWFDFEHTDSPCCLQCVSRCCDGQLVKITHRAALLLYPA